MLKVCVIGGGPSGLMAAYTASLEGHQVELFEKNKQLGKKLQLTGHGRCNVTNNCSKDEFLSMLCTMKSSCIVLFHNFRIWI